MSDDTSEKEAQLIAQRQEKAKGWRALGVDPYGNGFRPAHLAADIPLANGGKSVEELEQAALSYTVAGRVIAIRSFGKAAFLKLRDRSGDIQVHVKQDALGPEYERFRLTDVGDFVGVTGTLFRSKTGELTLAATRYLPLTKAVRPLPEKWHGLQDHELRYRQRYLDLLSNPQVKASFLRRIELVRFLRAFLDARGYVEVETPMMHSLVSGAAARPFVTHHNALDVDLFLRIAPELYLKRLVVGGLERVYEMNRNFRNEGLSTKHNPEFTMLEFYQAYATYRDLMDLTEEMVGEAAAHVTGSREVSYQGTALSFAKGWKRISMAEAVREAAPGLTEKDVRDPGALLAEFTKHVKPSEAEAARKLKAGELLGLLFGLLVEPKLVQPTFVTHFPVAISPLSRRSDSDPEMTDRFELFVAGREIANGFSELNDPADQRERFLEQVAAKERGQAETMDFDEDYVRALEHGLPPTAGEGIGIDRLAMLLTDAPSIRDVILFPLLRPQGQ
jgi:lysyl-tRNA synthetase, class II